MRSKGESHHRNLEKRETWKRTVNIISNYKEGEEEKEGDKEGHYIMIKGSIQEEDIQL